MDAIDTSDSTDLHTQRKQVYQNKFLEKMVGLGERLGG